MAPALAAENQPAGPTPSFQAEVKLVTVDVVVAGPDGAPVVGLKPDDFQLLEDGQPQTVTRFEAVELPSAPTAAPAPLPAVSSNTTLEARQARSFALVFDDAHIPPALTARARSVIAEFLQRNVRESDRVLLVATSGRAWWSARMEAGRKSLLALLGTLAGQRVPEGSSRERLSDYEALRIYRHQDQEICRRVLRRFVADGVMPDPELREVQLASPRVIPGTKEIQFSTQCNPIVAMTAQGVHEREVNRIRATLGALTRVMEGMALAQGRKTVILVSTGFVFDQELEEARQVIAASRRANAAVYFVDLRGLGVGNEQVFQAHYENPQIYGTTEEVRQPGAVQLSEDWQEAEGAVGVAADTGGFSVRNRNDLASGMGQIADESRAYYLLGYTPKNTRRNGKFRKIEVLVSRADVKVRARRGYFATDGRATSVQAGEMPAEMQRAADAPFEVDGIGLRAAAYVFEKAPSGQARVELVADIGLGKLAFEQIDGRHFAAVNALLSVARLEGGAPRSISEMINLRLRPEMREKAQYYPYRKSLHLEPGHYQARLVVHDRRGGVAGSVVHDFEVPKLDDWRVASPVLTDVATPSATGQPQLVPVARRDFPGAGTLLCSFEVYGSMPDSASRAPRVRLSYALRRGSEELARGEAQPAASGAEGTLGVTFGLPLAALAPGGYELALQFVDEVSGRSKELREPFTVVAVPPAAADAASGR